MAGYTNIRNSTANANSNYFTNAGSAINASNQSSSQDDTVMAGVRDDSLGNNMYGLVSTTKLVAYTGNDRTQIIMGLTNTLKGSANTTLREAGATPPIPISIPQLNSLRTERVASGIRAGLWSWTSGIFTSTLGKSLASTNDFSAVGNDLVADATRSAPGNIFYNQAGGLPTTTGLSSRTS